jgi:amidophosphoribosyltransferase
VSDGQRIWVDRGMGLVANVFDQYRLAALTGHIAIGHTRYSTTGSSTWENAQPGYRSAGDTQFAIAHNGNLVNTAELARALAANGPKPNGPDLASDSDVLAELLAAELDRPAADHAATGPTSGTAFVTALRAVLPRLQGAFSLALLEEHQLIGVRDPNGFRPLFLGRLGQPDDAAGWVLASETPAAELVGATVVRELDPGEVVIIDGAGVRSIRPFPPERINPRLCVFEFVYFARPDGQLYGQGIHAARQRMGEELAQHAPADADLVIPVPESAIPGAHGYARASGIPYGEGLLRNRYTGRTFIAPTPDARAHAVRMKLSAIKENIDGARLVVVEDSIVRATTLRETMRILRQAGAAEIHLRILSPPYQWPCYYGMDTADRTQLIAANHTIDEIRQHLDADTLAYLSLPRLLHATRAEQRGLCAACLTGDYPVPVPADRPTELHPASAS